LHLSCAFGVTINGAKVLHGHLRRLNAKSSGDLCP
jgi:hypothetical protein